MDRAEKLKQRYKTDRREEREKRGEGSVYRRAKREKRGEGSVYRHFYILFLISGDVLINNYVFTPVFPPHCVI